MLMIPSVGFCGWIGASCGVGSTTDAMMGGLDGLFGLVGWA